MLEYCDLAIGPLGDKANSGLLPSSRQKPKKESNSCLGISIYEPLFNKLGCPKAIFP